MLIRGRTSRLPGHNEVRYIHGGVANLLPPQSKSHHQQYSVSLDTVTVVQTHSRCLIAAKERPRTDSKQMATYQAVAQTQSISSSNRHVRACLTAARERLRTDSKQMVTYQAVVETQSRCLIAARERPRAGSKQMATYQAVVQTQRSTFPLPLNDIF